MNWLAPSSTGASLMRWTQGRRLFDRRALPLYALAAVAVALCVAAVASGAFDYDAALFVNLARPIGFFLFVAYLVRWAGFAALANLAEALLVGMFVTFLMAFGAAILAAADRPIADQLLAWIDASLLHVDRPTLTRFTGGHPWFQHGMAWIYESFGFTPQLLLAAAFLTGRARLGWTVATALSIALVATIGLSWILPAYGVAPYPYEFAEVLAGVRDGRLRRLDGTLVTGIVTFPSLHAADAVVLAWGYARLGRIGWPLVALNVLMVASAVVVGGHYVVDVIAGAGIAAASIMLARRIQAQLAPPAAISPSSSPRSAS